jgi:hypothetical protein
MLRQVYAARHAAIWSAFSLIFICGCLLAAVAQSARIRYVCTRVDYVHRENAMGRRTKHCRPRSNTKEPPRCVFSYTGFVWWNVRVPEIRQYITDGNYFEQSSGIQAESAEGATWTRVSVIRLLFWMRGSHMFWSITSCYNLFWSSIRDIDDSPKSKHSPNINPVRKAHSRTCVQELFHAMSQSPGPVSCAYIAIRIFMKTNSSAQMVKINKR